jgi:hypothetical protein
MRHIRFKEMNVTGFTVRSDVYVDAFRVLNPSTPPSEWELSKKVSLLSWENAVGSAVMLDTVDEACFVLPRLHALELVWPYCSQCEGVGIGWVNYRDQKSSWVRDTYAGDEAVYSGYLGKIEVSSRKRFWDIGRLNNANLETFAILSPHWVPEIVQRLEARAQ